MKKIRGVCEGKVFLLCFILLYLCELLGWVKCTESNVGRLLSQGTGSCLTGKEFQIGEGDKVLEVEVMGAEKMGMQVKPQNYIIKSC